MKGVARYAVAAILMGVANTSHQTRSTAVRRRIWIALLLLSAPFGALGDIEANLTRVGFPTIQLGDVFRGGAWTPLIVDLDLLGQSEFDGSVRVGQRDRDGDVCFDRVAVHLRADTGGAQRLYLYALADPSRDEGQFTVELFDDDGNAAQVVAQGTPTYQIQTEQKPRRLEDDDLLVLSLSTAAMGRVRELAEADQRVLFTRRVYVGHMSPSDLPELWIGLEAVDIIVWDDARPEHLTKRQVDALVEWVRQGGLLLIAASRTVSPIRLNEPLYEILPVDLGDVHAADNLPEVRRQLLCTSSDDDSPWHEKTAWWQVPFDNPVTVVEGALRPGAVRIPDDRDNRSNIVTRRDVGRGQVIFCGVTLRDLFRGGGHAVGMFRELFHLGPLSDSERAAPQMQALSPFVESAVAFAKSGSVYLMFAFVFSSVYVALATLGSWSALGVRGWRHHSWTAFAVVAGAASVLSVVAVNSIRGLGETLHQVSVIDVVAGASQGRATVLFGVKTGTDKRMDFWLPSDPLGATEPTATNCFLRPWPAAPGMGAGTARYADPGEYRLVPASAVVSNVRLRATLKQLEGRWSGAIRGTVSGEITAKRGGIQILDGSYLVNHLGVDLKDCYLFHTTRDLDRRAGPRSDEIYAYFLGDLPSDGNRVDLVQRCYRLAEGESLARLMGESDLTGAQKRWGAEFSSLLRGLGYGVSSDRGVIIGQEKNALLLASTVGEYDPSKDAGMAQSFLGARSWSRARLRQLDMREHFRPDTAVLVGFSDDPGPVRLFRRVGDRAFASLEPDPENSWAMYRVRIPVTLLGRADEAEEEPIR